MSEHYYTQQPSVASEERVIDVDVRGVHCTLVTDRGVFSKGGLDEATRRLIEAVDLAGAQNVLDLGAGYGVITAVLSQVFPHISWTLIDINERALALADRNTKALAPRRQIVHGDGVPPEFVDCFDAVLLNPPIRAGKAVMYRLYQEAYRSLKPSGRFWVVIQKKHGAPSTEVELTRLFGNVHVVSKKSGYFLFECKKFDHS